MPDATTDPPHADLPDTGITLAGTTETTLDASHLADIPWREHHVDVSCDTTEDDHAATWAGVSLLDALESVGVPDDTTHVAVTAHDGYRVCIALTDAIDAIIALTKDGEPLTDAADYETRLVAPTIGGTRTVKDVARIEPVALDPDDSPESLEEVTDHLLARIPDTTREYLEIQLAHNHLPKLADRNWIEYDPHSRQIQYGGHSTAPPTS